MLELNGSHMCKAAKHVSTLLHPNTRRCKDQCLDGEWRGESVLSRESEPGI